MVKDQSLGSKKGEQQVCDLCGYYPVQEVHCKLRCFNCGYTRDCSDP